uniref:Uncharacterized protein n=1 Tax=Ditylenchus dipsaci TaxID=166011 RepID=A0A915D3F4_9BILA
MFTLLQQQPSTSIAAGSLALSSAAAVLVESISTSTVLPIICLIEWNSPKCQEQAFEAPAPTVGSSSGKNQRSYSKNSQEYSNPSIIHVPFGDELEHHKKSKIKSQQGFFTPVLPKAFHHQQTSQPGVPPTRQPPISAPSSVPKTDSFSVYQRTSHELNPRVEGSSSSTCNEKHAPKAAGSIPHHHGTPAPKLSTNNRRLPSTPRMINKIPKPIYFEPPGGWPPRTRTGPDGRKYILGSASSSRQAFVNDPKRVVDTEDDQEDPEEGEEEDQEDDQPEEDEEEEPEEGFNDAKYYNQNGEQLKLENGNKVKALWKDLEKVIEQKQWQRATPTPRAQITRAAQVTSRIRQQQTISTTTKAQTTMFTSTQSPKKSSRESSPPSNVWIPYKPNESSQKIHVVTSKKVFEPITKQWTTPRLAEKQGLIRTSTVKPVTESSIIHFTFVASASGTQRHSHTASSSSSTPASTTIRQRHNTNPPYDPTLEAVRPTTPMNHPGMMSYTTKAPEQSEIPRTALVVLASLSVVLMVALILIFVFCKRSSSNQDTLTIPWKSMTGGYTAIAPSSTEPSPQFQHHQIDQPGVTFGTKVNTTQHNNKTMTSLLPSAMKNGGGYQPLKGSTLPLPTGNGQHMMGPAGTLPRGANGGGPPNGEVRQLTMALCLGMEDHLLMGTWMRLRKRNSKSVETMQIYLNKYQVDLMEGVPCLSDLTEKRSARVKNTPAYQQCNERN